MIAVLLATCYLNLHQGLVCIQSAHAPEQTRAQERPKWYSEEWEDDPQEATYRKIRRECEDLKWGLKKQVDVIDQKEVDRLVTLHKEQYLKSKSKEELFWIVSLMAHFYDGKVVSELRLIDVLKAQRDWQSYEFARVASAVLARNRTREIHFDFLERLLVKKRSDPLVLETYINTARLVNEYSFIVHDTAVDYAKELLRDYPKRDELYLMVAMIATYNKWYRARDKESKLECLAYIDKVQTHPQITDSRKRQAIGLKQMIEKG